MSGFGGRGPMEQLGYADMMGRSRGVPGLAVVTLASRAGGAITLLLMLVAFAGVTRTSLWNYLFPVRLPWGLAAARWLSVPTIVFGVLRLIGEGYLLLVSWNQLFSQARGPDVSVMVIAIALLDQAWMLGFWLTLIVLLVGMLNELIARYARPLQ